jgi:uncharacterized protein DUF4159
LGADLVPIERDDRVLANMSRNRRLFLTVVALLLAAGGAVLAQFGFESFRDPYRPTPNVPYDGRFTFVRVRYTPAPGGYWPGRRPSWIHGYPLAEQNLMKIMNEVTYLGAHENINTVTLDDPELFKYPIAYLIEVGWWSVTDREAAGLRDYLLKGGFLFIDDFKPAGWRGPGGGWEPFAKTMRRVLPDVQFFDLSSNDPVFHSFFEIDNIDHFPQAYVSGNPVFRGIFEDNDRSKRLMAIINYNTDVSQYWEWSGRGFRPFDQTNEAYKLAVNYLIYGLTH